MATTTTTETTFRAVIRHFGKNGEDYGKTYNKSRETIEEARADVIRINGSDMIRPTDEVEIEHVMVTTVTIIRTVS